MLKCVYQKVRPTKIEPQKEGEVCVATLVPASEFEPVFVSVCSQKSYLLEGDPSSLVAGIPVCRYVRQTARN